MRNQSSVVLLFLLLISCLIAYNKKIISSDVSEEFQCKDLASLDKRCAGVGAVLSAPSQIHNEMNDLSESYWSKYMCQNNGSSYILVNRMDDRLYELKEVRFTGTKYEQTPADKLNNIEQRGSLSVAALTSRFYSSDNKWAEWTNYGPSIGVRIEKINGQWQVENQDIYSFPDCSNLPQ